jgi:hypothetical protein
MTAVETALMELAYQIKKYLHDYNISAAMFSRKCGVTEEIVDRAIREEMIPTPEMQQICGVLKVTMDSLRRVPASENYQKLQQLVLDTVQSARPCSYQEAAKEIGKILDGTPVYEQNRNMRWLKQTIEHPEMYQLSPNRQAQRPKRKQLCPKFMSKHVLASSVCFTRKISRKQKEKLEQIIEDSKKK